MLTAIPELPLVVPPPANEPALADAFSAFSAAARSLEHSYFSLREEVKRLRQQLEQERELRLRREALAEMAAMVAHEVRNPLGSVELYADLLALSELGDEERMCVKQIQSGLRILSASVNNVLEFHSPSSREPVPVELYALLELLRKLVAPIFCRSQMDFILERNPEPLRILGNENGLMQAFLNISLNAARFASGGKVLRVRASRQRTTAVIDFEDRGPGISEEDRKKIFEPGFTTRTGGPGLGMAVAKRIIDRHQGKIGIISKLGKGSTFRIELPLVRFEH